MIDKLIEGIKQKKCPVCVGLDTLHSYLPLEFRDVKKSLKFASQAIYDFNKEIIDAIYDIVPSVKIQSACYEMYGHHGVHAMERTIRYAKKLGLVTIADVKRNDIGSTASAYSKAYLGEVEIGGEFIAPFDADFITVTPYLGSDGIVPFLEDCKKYNKGIFVLVKTSNPSGGEVQNLKVARRMVYNRVADMVQKWGSDMIGEYDYSNVGAVVGATYPEEAEKLRKKYKKTFFLIPGYGAQGATADDVVGNFDKHGLGGVVNNSRGVLLAYKKHTDLSFQEAARKVVLDMKEDILGAFERKGLVL